MDWQETWNRSEKIEVKLEEKTNLRRIRRITKAKGRREEEIRSFSEKIRADKKKIINVKEEIVKRMVQKIVLKKKQKDKSSKIQRYLIKIQRNRRKVEIVAIKNIGLKTTCPISEQRINERT